jgi:hypothetical protein
MVSPDQMQGSAEQLGGGNVITKAMLQATRSFQPAAKSIFCQERSLVLRFGEKTAEVAHSGP